MPSFPQEVGYRATSKSSDNCWPLSRALSLLWLRPKSRVTARPLRPH